MSKFIIVCERASSSENVYIPFDSYDIALLVVNLMYEQAVLHRHFLDMYIADSSGMPIVSFDGVFGPDPRWLGVRASIPEWCVNEGVK